MPGVHATPFWSCRALTLSGPRLGVGGPTDLPFGDSDIHPSPVRLPD
jgi:hypothetical protein